MAHSPVKAATAFKQSLHQVNCSQGYILGVANSELGVILMDLYRLSDGTVAATDAADLSVLLPYGWHVLGCFIKSLLSQQDAAACATELLNPVQELLPRNAVSVVVLVGDASEDAKYFEISSGTSLSPLNNGKQAPTADISNSLLALRCRCTLDLPVYTSDAGDTASGLKVAHQSAANRLDASKLAFLIDRPGGQPTVISTSSSGTIKSLLPSGSSSSQPLLTAQPLLNCTTSDRAPEEFAYDYQPVAADDCKLQSIKLYLDVLCVVHRMEELRQVVDGFLQPALQRQLCGVVEQLRALGSLEEVQKVTVHHCQPPGRQHYVTMIYVHQSANLEEVESAHLSLRQRLHARMGLPEDQPCLRMAHALPWGLDAQAVAATRAVQRLRNVHEGLTPPVPGGKVYLVDGIYDYHHYMQDKLNDAGWGCAYRSLQTICSWFRAQHFTNKPVPSHREIQEILVKIGDKDASFVASCNWIGAIELSYVLDEYLGVTCKIVAVNRGEDILTRARELAQHFVTQGTPVMIGGGVLAYTLLGVQLHEQTGDCAFLILDPHYTGGEDLQKIHQGTWVAWKKFGDSAAAGGPLFMPDAFYNFLCPQRPRIV